MSSLLHQTVTERILGEYYRVFNELRFGFREAIYQRAMVIALTQAELRVQEQVPMRVYFRGISIGFFAADIVVERVVLLEIKATKNLETRCEPQALNYLSASDLELALILNFGEKPEFKRLVLTNDRKYRPQPLQPRRSIPCESVKICG
jgi:GxxExxY protein